MIISFLLNFSGKTREQRNNSLQVSVGSLELLPHVVEETRMCSCRLCCKGWHVSERGMVVWGVQAWHHTWGAPREHGGLCLSPQVALCEHLRLHPGRAGTTVRLVG